MLSSPSCSFFGAAAPLLAWWLLRQRLVGPLPSSAKLLHPRGWFSGSPLVIAAGALPAGPLPLQALALPGLPRMAPLAQRPGLRHLACSPPGVWAASPRFPRLQRHPWSVGSHRDSGGARPLVLVRSGLSVALPLDLGQPRGGLAGVPLLSLASLPFPGKAHICGHTEIFLLLSSKFNPIFVFIFKMLVQTGKTFMIQFL